MPPTRKSGLSYSQSSFTNLSVSRRFLGIGRSLIFGFTLASDVALSQEDLTDLPLEDLLKVEIISSRLPQKSSEAPSSISVLTAEDIRSFGWRSLAEALNAIRGLFVSNDRNYSYLGVRGFRHPNDYNSRVLLMVDGQRMNENIFDGAYIGQTFLLDIGLIERIEFIPGTGSSIYGANAVLGLINVITKTGKAINGTQVAGEYGSFDTYKGRLSYGKQFDNGTDLLLSASHYDSAGATNLYFPEFDAPSSNHGIAENRDDERADRLFGRVQYQAFTLMGGYVDRYKQIPTAPYQTLFNDPDTHTSDTQFFVNLKYVKALSDNTDLSAKGYYQGYDYHGVYPYQDVTRIVNEDYATGRWWGGEIQLTSTAFERQRWLLGLEYQYDQRQHEVNYDIAPYVSYVDANRAGHRVELYAQDDIQIYDRVIFSAGLRLDYHHMLNNLQINPRLGLIWNPTDNATFKLLYSSTFRAPNAWERDYSTLVNTPNPNNYEEHIKSYEALLEWRSANGILMTGNLFYNSITGLLEQNNLPGFGGVGQFVNVGNYDAIGFELEAEKRWYNGRLLKLSYTYSRVEDKRNGSIWAYASPENLLKLHYAEPLFNDLARVGIENVFVDQRRTVQPGIADAYYQLNVNLSSNRLIPGVDISIGAYNLFDSHYQMLGGTGPADITQNILRMNGRQFRLKMQITF
ncbi:MAG: TonB-dependent receptor plug domain-containing protein [Gammaproteobacteria bacterium]